MPQTESPAEITKKAIRRQLDASLTDVLKSLHIRIESDKVRKLIEKTSRKLSGRILKEIRKEARRQAKKQKRSEARKPAK